MNENENNLAGSPYSLPPHLQVGKSLSKEVIKKNKIFLAAGAVVVGNVEAHEDVSFWYNCVVRADVNKVVIGSGSNLQDGAIVHVTNSKACLIGKNVTIGHGAIIHAATIESAVLIGMGATILSGGVIGSGSVIAAGAVIKEGEIVPPNTLMAGVPARQIKTLSQESITSNNGWAKKYIALKNEYLKKANT